MQSTQTQTFNKKINLLFNETAYPKPNKVGNSPPKFRMGHKTFRPNNIKKIKSQTQSPQHFDGSARESVSFRKSLNLKTQNQNIQTERINIKNSINCILERKYNGGNKAALGKHSVDKKTQSVERTHRKSKIMTKQIIIRTDSKEKYDKNKNSDLTEFQKEEISIFPLLFKGKRRIHHKKQFTDQEGNCLAQKGDSVAYRYQILQTLGKGAFGKVFRAFDHKKSELVALKIIRSLPKLNQQAKIEIEILEKAVKNGNQNQCNIVKMKGSFVFRGHSCITYEILSKNLYEYIKNSNFKPTPQKIIVKFAIQILHSLLFLNHINVVHCDIKPENIMLKEPNKTGIRVIDLGSSCYESEQYYTYIQSRFYRAPEIILGIRYSPAIDMWSFGLVLVELLTGYPLFPGQTEQEQLLIYMQVLGKPPTSLLERGTRRKKFFTQDLRWKKENNLRINRLSLEKVLDVTPSPPLLDLIKRCLEWTPQKRITPKQALLHDWVIRGIPENIRERHIIEVNNEDKS